MIRKLLAATAAAALFAAPAFAQQPSNPGDTVTVGLTGRVVDVCEVEWGRLGGNTGADLFYGGTNGVVNVSAAGSAEDTAAVTFDFEIPNIDNIAGSPAIGQITAGSVLVYFNGYCNDDFTATIQKGQASGRITSSSPGNSQFNNFIDYTATMFWNGRSVTAGPGQQTATNDLFGPTRGDLLVRAFWNATSNLVSGSYTDVITLTLAADS